MSDLSGQHAVVTGGGSGVGAAIALALAGAGAKVTVTGRRAEALGEIAAQHNAITPAAGDVTDEASLFACYDTARAENGPIDLVIANAGAATSKPFAKSGAGDLRQMLEVNLVGVFNSFHAALPDMLGRGSGKMIAISSIAGLRGAPYIAPYCASKHGVIGLVRSLSLELAPKGITVNAICPGYVDTPMTDRTIDNIVAKTGMDPVTARTELEKFSPQNRLIEVDEIAGTVLWLCSDAARSVNGAAIPITGGDI